MQITQQFLNARIANELTFAEEASCKQKEVGNHILGVFPLVLCSLCPSQRIWLHVAQSSTLRLLAPSS